MKKEFMIEFFPSREISEKIERFMRIQKEMDPIHISKPGNDCVQRGLQFGG
jgi:hypothetical protein